MLNLEDINYISKEEFESITNSAKPRKGDILFTRVGSNLGHPVIYEYDENICIFVSLGFIRVKDELVINDYIKHWMNSQAFWNQVKRKTAGAAKINLNNGWMYDFDLKVPSLKDQRIISTFLDNLDNKIQTQIKIIEDLIFQKEYITQKFFKEINKNERILLSGILREYISKTNCNNQYPVLSSTASGIYLQKDYFNKEAASEDTTGYKIIPRGYCTYRSMSDTGKFNFNQQNLVDYGIVSPAYPVFYSEDYDLSFVILYLNKSVDIQKQIIELKTGGTRFALSFKTLCNLKIPYISKEEQQSIMKIIVALDNRINNEKTIYANMIIQKQFLLNNMFT